MGTQASYALVKILGYSRCVYINLPIHSPCIVTQHAETLSIYLIVALITNYKYPDCYSIGYFITFYDTYGTAQMQLDARTRAPGLGT